MAEDEVRDGILGSSDSSALVGDHETLNLKREAIVSLPYSIDNTWYKSESTHLMTGFDYLMVLYWEELTTFHLSCLVLLKLKGYL